MSAVNNHRSQQVILTVGNGFMKREDRNVPCGFREPPKSVTSKRKFRKGSFGYWPKEEING